MRWLLELLRVWLRRTRPTGMVRPWALAAPVLVLILALPLLRPIRHTDPRLVSDDELALLATTQSLVEFDTTAIDQSQFLGNTQRRIELADRSGGKHWYADQPPMMAALLSGAYRLMRLRGLSFSTDTPIVAYVLTLLGVTLPAACAAGLVYRMGRLFELPRPKRAALAFVTVFGTGLFSYSTVLNVHVPAATLVLLSAACLTHLSIAARSLTALWLAAAGFTAALGATIDPTAIPFAVLFAFVVPSYRWRWWGRLGGLAVYLVAATLPILAHLMLSAPISGSFRQGIGFAPPAVAAPAATEPVDDDDDAPGLWTRARVATGDMLNVLFGAHGLLSHFPVLVLGVLGVTMVMHRHWPQSAKVLAAASLAGGAFVVITYALHRPDNVDWRDAMYASRWFVVLGPMLTYWGGAWLRRSHRRGSWILATAAITISVAVGLLGATNPWPRDGYRRWTVAEAATRLYRQADAAEDNTVVLPAPSLPETLKAASSTGTPSGNVNVAPATANSVP